MNRGLCNSYGNRDAAPPCRHTKALIEKELKIKNLKEHKLQAEAENKQLQFDRQQEQIRNEHYKAVIDSQSFAIHELEEILKKQQTVIDSIFGETGADQIKDLENMTAKYQ